MKKRLFSMLLALCMVFTLLSMTAFAVTPLYKVIVDTGPTPLPPIPFKPCWAKRASTPMW